MIGRTLGRYEIVRQLGAGGMGVVYAARDKELGREVAIKILPDELAEDSVRRTRFEREAKTIASLNHPNICTLHDIGQENGVRFLVMELIEGESLEERLTKERLTREKVLEYGAQIADALDRAHERGVVHRDLKPGNVMLTKTGVKLLDFGLAQMRRASAEDMRDMSTEVKSLTAEGTILGTLPYMAPEQLHGTDADERTDIFALGTVLYEMLTGFRAFGGTSRASVISAIVSGAPEPIRQLQPLTPPALEHVIQKCLEKEPDNRWQSAHDVATELAWIAETGLDQDEPSEALVGQQQGETVRRWKVAATALAVALVVAVIAVVWFGRSLQKTPPPNGLTKLSQVPKLVRLTWEPGGAQEPKIAPDGEWFAYIHGPSDRSSVGIYLQRIGGRKPIALADRGARDLSPSFSPDGQLIAFVSNRDTPDDRFETRTINDPDEYPRMSGIYVMGAMGENVRRLTEEGAFPSFSPDGKSIAYSSETVVDESMNAPTTTISVVGIDGGTPRKIFDGLFAGMPLWSPSGTRIAFSGLGRSGKFAISSIPADGGDPVEAFSLDGDPHLVAYCWVRGHIWFMAHMQGIRAVWRIPVDETSGEALGEPELIHRSTASFGSRMPFVSSDGKRVVFTDIYQSRPIQQWNFDPVEGRVTSNGELLLDHLLTEMKSVSPDKRWIATKLMEEGRDLFLIETATGRTLPLTDSPEEIDDWYRWTPDSSRVFFVAYGDGASDLWSIRADGSGKEMVIPTPEGRIAMFEPSPDGRHLFLNLGKDQENALVDLSLPFEERKPVPIPDMESGVRPTLHTWSPDGRSLRGQIVSQDPRLLTLIEFDMESRKYRELAKLPPPGLPGRQIGWLPDGRRMLTWSEPNLMVLDTATGTVTEAGTLGNGFHRFALSRDGQTLYGQQRLADSDIWMLEYEEAP